MPRRAAWVLAAAVALAALGAGLWLGTTQRQTSQATADAATGLTTLGFTNLQGATQSLADLRGQVLVVNFWATWCPPCREEIPSLIRTQTRFGPEGVQIVGIAIDSVDKTREYASNIGINYPILIGGMETVDLVRSLGNKAGGLPFTVILDRQGKVVEIRKSVV